MRDEEMVRLCAERVMGWQEGWDDLHWFTDWNPLTSEEDAGAVLDKMQEEGWAVSIFGVPWISSVQLAWMVGFDRSVYPPERTKDGVRWHSAINRCRAIVLAALKAVGVEVEA